MKGSKYMGISVMTFKIGEYDYSIEMKYINAIVHDLVCTPVSESHPSIDGIVDYLDTVITQVNLIKHLGFEEDDKQCKRDTVIICRLKEKGKGLLAKEEEKQIAFKITSIKGIVELKNEEVYELDTILKNSQKLFKGSFKSKDSVYINNIIDIETIYKEIIGED